MKKYASIVCTLVFTVFIFFFALGRTNAKKDTTDFPKREEEFIINENTIYPASSNAEKVIKNVEIQEKEDEEINTEQDAKEITSPPERMLYPCGEVILKDYSQKAVYSKTMDDWRAHTGIDYEAKKGENVTSVWDGTVQNVYMDMFWGYTVEIVHDGDLISVYKNLDKKILVKKGESVKSGQVIGKVGDTATVEEREVPHLHFELWTGGEPINPHSYIY